MFSTIANNRLSTPSYRKDNTYYGFWLTNCGTCWNGINLVIMDPLRWFDPVMHALLTDYVRFPTFGTIL